MHFVFAVFKSQMFLYDEVPFAFGYIVSMLKNVDMLLYYKHNIRFHFYCYAP